MTEHWQYRHKPIRMTGAAYGAMRGMLMGAVPVSPFAQAIVHGTADLDALWKWRGDHNGGARFDRDAFDEWTSAEWARQP